ncbi:MAG TPA: COX15/CtaA family protein [Myxococcaceae bacterium]|nr:COX15/CtaA family protein [Myxococcaceae bacterium]
MTSRSLWRFSLGVLAFNLVVILWGAYVRASGSGAGCGSHWPLCNGVVVPRAPELKTLVELSHRLTSGLALALVVALFAWTFRAFPKGHVARRAAAYSLGFIITEALIGAAIVLLRLVAYDESISRAFSTSAHLINTFLLVASLVLTCWFIGGGQPFRVRGHGSLGALFLGGWAGTLLVGTSGAVAALGDTLFPSRSLAEGLAQDLSPAAHLFIRLRILHPIFAVAVAGVLLAVAAGAKAARTSPRVGALSNALMGLVALQVVAGILNVALLAPIAMQLLHLLIADALWIALVLLTAETASAPRAEPAPSVAVA